ncbi:acetyl-CoA carboxylase, biotin carboxylase subunit [Anaerosphaera aminiphila DSM 21120]|uniref:Biotin carboxylase n=1 Tax=Anaerosphaera aminiphila DSM 21120 TaxID=1120995 RepID=A0A1M5U2P0_9FIRM|nr:acetyl-CoA carboxylase biotin carboxylase subunit [Anaerosphaera aminiphila]SHH56933.1 acetyl-CoA carboxylase, biotin carboxylase subunit [Anaerosphaera aminiphila DSM 21120]
MIKKLLIANRGEIALRIIRSAEELQIKTVAVYSTEDAEQLHVKFADESVCIGPAKSSESYLNINNIISAALATKCDAVAPGYGFLSENAKFVRALEEAGLKFVGPSSEVIDMMGDKIAARDLMKKNGVPVVPGSDGEVVDVEEAFIIAEKIGYPVLIKASGGGGGKGMRRVYKSEDLKIEFESAKSEAIAAFNNGSMYIEKLIVSPKHVEVQILADKYSNIIALGERDCSIQRKNQKMIEETPCIRLTEEKRKELYSAAIKAAKACNYENAGTVEFVLDRENNFYFIEMNTRIQVEHPVTEMVTGVDLVKEQLKITSGLKLKIKQEDININSYAIECRLNAEKPLENFLPESGNVNFFYAPGGVNTRVDSYLYSGAKVSPYYDSMLGKIIVKDSTRIGAIRKMRRALEELIIEGIKTNQYLLYAILFDMDFIRGNYSTSFIEDKLEELLNLMEAYR